MPFKYHDPRTVASPRKFIRKVDVLYDGGPTGFSLAVLDWEGTDHMGMRWNIGFKEQQDAAKESGDTICNGSPSLNSVPSWFILPRELFNPAFFDKESEMFLNLVTEWKKAKQQI